MAPRSLNYSTSRFNPRTIGGALSLAGMLLLVVAGFLGLFLSVDRFGGDTGATPVNDADGGILVHVLVLLLALLLFACAWMVWTGMAPLAGVLALVTGIVMVVLYPETAGILAILGGVAILFAHFAPLNQGRREPGSRRYNRPM